MNDIEKFVNHKFLIIDEEYGQTNLCREMLKAPQDFIILVDKKGLPKRITTLQDLLGNDRVATEDINVLASKWTVPIMADVSTPKQALVSLLVKPEVRSLKGIVILKDSQIIGVVPKDTLQHIISQLHQEAGLESTRFPDIYGVLSLQNIPLTICYICFHCGYYIETGLHVDIPICKTPWHGKMILTSCSLQAEEDRNG